MWPSSSAATRSTVSLPIYALLVAGALATSRNPATLAAALAPAVFAIASLASDSMAGPTLDGCEIHDNQAEVLT